MLEEIQNLNENEAGSLVKAPYDKKLYLENGFSKLKELNMELRKRTRPDL